MNEFSKLYSNDANNIIENILVGNMYENKTLLTIPNEKCGECRQINYKQDALSDGHHILNELECIDNDTKYNIIRINLCRNPEIENKCWFLKCRRFSRLLFDLIDDHGTIQIYGSCRNNQVRRIASLFNSSCDVHMYYGEENLSLLIPENGYDLLIHYYTVVNPKRWYIRLILKIILIMDIGRYVVKYGRTHVALIYKNSN